MQNTDIQNVKIDLKDLTIETGMSLLEWCRDETIRDEMYWKGAATKQILFMRDDIVPLLFLSKRDVYTPQAADICYIEQIQRVRVISDHRSKLIDLLDLPVYLVITDYGVRYILRNDFFDWKVTVISEQAIKKDTFGVFPQYFFDFKEEINRIHCEGFADNWVLGSFANNQQAFTFETLNNYYTLYTLLWLIKEQFKKDSIK